MEKSIAAVFGCFTVVHLAWPGTGFLMVKGDLSSISDIFVPIQICHKAIYLYGAHPDDNLTNDVMNSLISLDQPFELHTKKYVNEIRYNEFNVVARLTCIAHIVVVRDCPMLRELKMNLLLKRFNRKTGNENDFVLVFALSKDGISGWSDWRMATLKYLMPANFPDNALLIELDECLEHEYYKRHLYCISDTYTFQLYCDEEEEVCWRPQSIIGQVFPKLKSDFDSEFIRARAHWRYDYNGWPILYYEELPGDFDDVAKMTFRHAAWGRFTWDEYMSKNKYPLYAPMVWLTLGIAKHLNATLIPTSRRKNFQHATTIRPRQWLIIDRVLKITPASRSVILQFGYVTFGYCTNGTRLRESMKMLAIFNPFDFICWVLLGLVMVSTAMLPLLVGRGIEILKVLACLGSQSINVNSSHRLGMVLVLWQVVAFLLSNFYAAFIESILAAPGLLPRIQDFKGLNQSCEVPWVLSYYQDDFMNKLSGVQHLKALMGRSKTTESWALPKFFRYLVEHEGQCLIYQSPIISAPLWTELAKKFEPGATCTEGNEKLIGDPQLWQISPPNAAIGYRIVRALEVTGILMKFGEYFESRLKQSYYHFIQLNLKNRTYGVEMENLDSERINIFSMSNSQVRALFTSFVTANFFAFCSFLIEYARLFVEISWIDV